MTFTQIVTEILDRLNLTSSTATTRVGRAVNRKYRLVTTSIGLQLSRRTTITQAVTPGVSTVVFTNTEKVIGLSTRASTPYRFLQEVTIEELQERLPFALTDGPTHYAVVAHTSDTVTVQINRTPQTAFTLYADVHQAVADLSGSNEPSFPESFHDVLVEGVLSDELRKMEKANLANIAQKEFDRILSDLKMWIAKNNYQDVYQGKTSTENRRFGASGSGGSGSSASLGTIAYTQTELITFDRNPSAPFAVTAGSAKVDNLDADFLDGFTEAEFAKLADNETISGNWAFDGSTDFDGLVDVTNGALILPLNTVPAQTADGSVIWDSDSDLLTVGTGASRKIMVDLDSTQTLTNKSLTNPTIAAGTLSGTFTGAPTFSGGPTISTTALNLTVGQIAFPASQNASAGANVLDDYEEGTWTPAFGGSGGQSGQAYSVQVGRYTKVGRYVHVIGSIVLSTLGTITGNVQITGLPFTVGEMETRCHFGLWGATTTALVWLSGLATNGGTVITLYAAGGAVTSITTLAQANLANTTSVRFSMSYFV